MSSMTGYWRIGKIVYEISDRVGYLGVARHAAYKLLRRRFGCKTPELRGEQIFVAIGILEERQRLIEHLMSDAKEWDDDYRLGAVLVPKLVRAIFSDQPPTIFEIKCEVQRLLHLELQTLTPTVSNNLARSHRSSVRMTARGATMSNVIDAVDRFAKRQTASDPRFLNWALAQEIKAKRAMKRPPPFSELELSYREIVGTGNVDRAEAEALAIIQYRDHDEALARYNSPE